MSIIRAYVRTAADLMGAVSGVAGAIQLPAVDEGARFHLPEDELGDEKVETGERRREQRVAETVHVCDGCHRLGAAFIREGAIEYGAQQREQQHEDAVGEQQWGADARQRQAGKTSRGGRS